MTRPLPMDIVLDAAQFALSRTTVGVADIEGELDLKKPTARNVLRVLHLWSVVGPSRGGAARAVVIGRVHTGKVLATIMRHGGVVPDPHPLTGLTHPGLTDQRRAVLDLVAEGVEYAEIGTQLTLNYWTVKSHVRRLCEEFGAHNRAHLVTIAHRRGLLPNPYRTTTKELQSGKDTR